MMAPSLSKPSENSISRAQQFLAGKRILVIVQNESVPFDRRVWQQARALRSAGATVTIISPMDRQGEARYEHLEGIHIYRHPIWFEARNPIGYLIEYSISFLWQLILALRIYSRAGFDLIHACNPPDLIFLVAVIFKPLGVKLIFDHHDINPELYEAKFGRRDLIWSALVLAERLTFLTADVVIATNESYRRIAIGRGKKSPDKVFVVRNGPDLSRLKIAPSNDVWKRGRSYLVGYVGVIGQQEGIDLLLLAADHIVRVLHREDIQFCIVGSGPHLSECQREAIELGLSDVVTFAGRTSDHVLFEILSTADVCVNPDRVTPFSDQSTMIKILEYMALGKPIVQFEVTEGRFTAQSASLYAKPNDPADFAEQIVELLESPELRSSMGQIGLARIKKELCWEHQIPNLLAAYARVFDVDA
jgi:glycosyltransferase involved in cell wall biosynthesis